MILQPVRWCEGSAADVIDKVLITCMDLLVLLLVTRNCGEALAAKLTSVRFNTVMQLRCNHNPNEAKVLLQTSQKYCFLLSHDSSSQQTFVSSARSFKDVSRNLKSRSLPSLSPDSELVIFTLSIFWDNVVLYVSELIAISEYVLKDYFVHLKNLLAYLHFLSFGFCPFSFSNIISLNKHPKFNWKVRDFVSQRIVFSSHTWSFFS